MPDKKNSFLNNIVKNYIASMRKTTTWGGDLELKAIGDIYNLKIFLYKNGRQYNIVDNPSPAGTIHLFHRNGHYSVCDAQGNITNTVPEDGNCLFSACYTAINNLGLRPVDFNISINNPAKLRLEVCKQLEIQYNDADPNNEIRTALFNPIFAETDTAKLVKAAMDINLCGYSQEYDHLPPNNQLVKDAFTLKLQLLLEKRSHVGKKRKRDDNSPTEVEELLAKRKKLQNQLEVLCPVEQSMSKSQKQKAPTRKTKCVTSVTFDSFTKTQQELAKTESKIQELTNAAVVIQRVARTKLSRLKVEEIIIEKTLQEILKLQPNAPIDHENLSNSIKTQIIQLYGQVSWAIPFATQLASYMLSDIPYVCSIIAGGANTAAFAVTAKNLYDFYHKSPKNINEYAKLLLAGAGVGMAMKTIASDGFFPTLGGAPGSCKGLTGDAEKICRTKLAKDFIKMIKK